MNTQEGSRTPLRVWLLRAAMALVVIGVSAIDPGAGAGALFIFSVIGLCRKSYTSSVERRAQERAAYEAVPLEERQAQWEAYDAAMFAAWDHDRQQDRFEVLRQHWRMDNPPPVWPN